MRRGQESKFGLYGSFLPTHERRPACDVRHMKGDAAQHPGRSCKTEKERMTGYVNEIHTKKVENRKEPRKEIGHKDCFDVNKINMSFKEVNKLGLPEASAYKEMNAPYDERNGVPKQVLGRLATHEKIHVNSEHVKHIGMKNQKTCDIHISKESLKEENKEVTKAKFKEAVNETLLGNMRHKEPAKTDSKGFHARGADHNIEQFDIKNETGMVHCIEGTNQVGHRYFDRELSRKMVRRKKRDIADEYDLENFEHVSDTKACVSKGVVSQSLPEQEKYGPKLRRHDSFLPTNEESPARHPRAKSPVPVPNYSSQRPGNAGDLEKAPMSVVAAKIDSFARSNPSVQVNTVYDYPEETLAVIGGELDENHPMERMAVLSDGSDGKRNKLRSSSKLDSKTVSEPIKSAIYSALGLESSPSMSLDYSPDKGQMVSTKAIMTSHQVPGGYFFSPPQYALFNSLVKEDFSDSLSKDGCMEAEYARHPGKSCTTEKVLMTGCMNKIEKMREKPTKDGRKESAYKDVSGNIVFSHFGDVG